MAVASFDYALWSATFPELAPSVSEATATLYFNIATLKLDNTDASLVTDVTQRLALLNLIVAHLAKLFSTIGGVAPSGLVGRLAGATEGSVSVQTEYAANSASAAWWVQTPYGALYWELTAPYRTARYLPGPRPYLGTGPTGLGWGGRWPL